MSKRQIFRIGDLSGGLNPDQNELLIADNEAAESLNFRIDKIGSLLSRKGYTRYVTVEEPDNIVAMGRWREEEAGGASTVVIATDGGTIRTVDLSLDQYTTVHTGLSATEEGMFLSVQQYLIYANGADLPVVYDGTTADTLGITGPVVSPTLGTPGVGTLNGTYQYAYTYASTGNGWESNPSPSRTATPSTESVVLNLVASTDASVDFINIYRTVAGGATLLFLAQVAAATASYTDTGSVALSALAVATDLSAPLAFENIAYYKGYMFGSIGNILYWSKALNIAAWPVLNSTEVPFEGNDTITALKSHQDTLIIFGENNTLLLAGDGGNWQMVRKDVSLGCTNRKAIAEVEDGLVFLSYQGLYVFPTFQQYAPKLTRALDLFTNAQRRSASMVYVDEERSLWLSIADRTWTIHLLNQGIGRYSFYVKDFLPGGDDGYRPPLWIDAVDSATATHKWVNIYGGTTDLGAGIPLKWKSKVFQLSNPEFVKFVRRIGAYATRGGNSAVTITVADNLNSYTVVLDSAGSSEQILWDQFSWDIGTWSGEGIGYFIGSLPAHTLIGRVLQITVDATVVTETELVSPISIEFRESDRFLGV